MSLLSLLSLPASFSFACLVVGFTLQTLYPRLRELSNASAGPGYAAAALEDQQIAA